jgi:site-specific DNA-methyltransferase (adenine-specific)
VLDEPTHIRAIFSDRTLGQLLWMRRNLDREDRSDRFILAATAGILHLNAGRDGVPRGLSVSMPNTFSMAPGYVARYTRNHRLLAPEVDVVMAVRRRTERLRPYLELLSRGRAWREDVLAPSRSRSRSMAANLIFTSPPYLHVMKYGKLNWLRLWLLGEEPKEVDDGLFATSSLKRYLAFLLSTLQGLSQRLADDGYCCLVLGDVEDPVRGTIRLADEVAAECLGETGFKLLGLVADHLPDAQKVSRIWGETRGRATKTDRILILGGRKAHSLPSVPVIDWSRGYAA